MKRALVVIFIAFGLLANCAYAATLADIHIASGNTVNVVCDGTGLSGTKPNARTYRLTCTGPTTTTTTSTTVAPTTTTTVPAPALPSGQLTRRGLMLPPGPPGSIDEVKTGPRVVLKEGPTTYRMWYEAVPGANRAVVGYATSSDGFTWAKQGAVLYPSASWEGGPNGEVSPNTVLLEGGVYKMWYHSYDGANRRIGYATSPDGLTWTKNANPVLNLGPAGAWDSNQIAGPMVVRVGNVLRMYYGGQRAGDQGWSMGYATSTDGVTWTRQSRLWGNGDITAFGVLLDERGWHMWWSNLDFTAINYASSTDGLTWVNGPNNPVLIPNPDPNSPDHEGVGDAISVYRDGSQYRVMYTGINIGSWPYPPYRLEAICIAVIG